MRSNGESDIRLSYRQSNASRHRHVDVILCQSTGKRNEKQAKKDNIHFGHQSLTRFVDFPPAELAHTCTNMYLLYHKVAGINGRIIDGMLFPLVHVDSWIMTAILLSEDRQAVRMKCRLSFRIFEGGFKHFLASACESASLLGSRNQNDEQQRSKRRVSRCGKKR